MEMMYDSESDDSYDESQDDSELEFEDKKYLFVSTPSANQLRQYTQEIETFESLWTLDNINPLECFDELYEFEDAEDFEAKPPSPCFPITRVSSVLWTETLDLNVTTTSTTSATLSSSRIKRRSRVEPNDSSSEVSYYSTTTGQCIYCYEITTLYTAACKTCAPTGLCKPCWKSSIDSYLNGTMSHFEVCYCSSEPTTEFLSLFLSQQEVARFKMWRIRKILKNDKVNAEILTCSKCCFPFDASEVDRNRSYLCQFCWVELCPKCWQHTCTGTCNGQTAGPKKRDLRGRMYKFFKTKRCPNCKTFIEKSGGCHHMTCSTCQRSFCWDCGKITGTGHKPLCGHKIREWGLVAGLVVIAPLWLPLLFFC
eukprot:TRINITY_DN3090_c0_g1_i1.p1 TRINITY_DN3090_c0_g1~~TRINITY_DN3090_c0_g1_i1.p1  ORF type:complete len:367 (-),score=45.86 TRINITY_DN3090_c0_g1_i1:97-1197(-)